MASDTRSKVGSNGKVREKVHLKAGFHLVDWMRLMSVSGHTKGAKKVTLKELAEHSSEFDCWTAYNGKVYNITQYLHYHPGGVPKLLQGAGKDCTALFDKYHRWVNIDSMLAKYIIGVLEEDEVDEIIAPASLATADAASVFTTRSDTTGKLVALSLSNSEPLPSSVSVGSSISPLLPVPPLPPSISQEQLQSSSIPIPLVPFLEKQRDLSEEELATDVQTQSLSALALYELNKEEN